MNSTEEPAGPLLRSQFEQFRAMLSSHRSLVASLSLFSSWLFAMSWSGVLSTSLGVFAAGSGMNGFWLTSLVVCTLVLGVFFSVPRLRRGVGSIGLAASACCMAASVASVGVAGLVPGAESYLRFGGGVLSGLGTGVMTAYWGMLITRYDSGVVLHFVAFSLLVSAVLTILMSLAPRIVALACMVALPFAAMHAFRLALRSDNEVSGHAAGRAPASPAPPAEPAAAGRSKGRISPLAVFMGLVVVLGVSAGLLRSLMSADVQADQGAWVFGIATIGAVAMLLLSKVPGGGESFALFYRAIGFIAAAFIVMALAVQQTAGRESFALGIHTMGFMYFYGLLWVFCVIYTRQYADAARVFIGGFLANQAGQIVGALAGGWFQTAFDAQAVVSPVSNAMIYLLLFATIALMARLSSASKPRETMTSEESMARACAIASKRHGLTPRESEILRYLVKGYDRGFVAQSLSVLSETVKSHTRHIYEKLGAHTRLELFNAVARCLDEEAGA